MSELIRHASLFLSGVSLACFAAAGLFFLRFWHTSRDQFFLLFGVACWMLAIERLVALFLHSALETIRTAETEQLAWLFLFRLFAFIAIGYAVWLKNKSKDGR